MVVFAFSHYDNVLAYTNALAKYTDLDVTVVLVAHGDRFATSTFQTDLSRIGSGLVTENVRSVLMPEVLQKYFHPNLKFWLLKLAPLRVTLPNLLTSLFHVIRLAGKSRKVFDIFHFNGTGIYSLALSYLLRTKHKILTIHDYVAHSGEGCKQYSTQNKKLVGNFRHFIQHYDHLAKGMASHFKLPAVNVHTLRSGTFDHFRCFSGPSPNYGNYILFFGRISPYKGLVFLVDGFNKFCESNNGLNLVIAGAGNTDDIRDKIALNPRIKLLNRRIPIEELVPLIQNCRFVVCPYVDATHSAVSIVSYTFQKPVVASRVGGLSEVVLHDKTGLLVDGQNTSSLAQAIDELSKDDGLLLQMSENIAILCTSGILGWEQIAISYAKVYASV